MPSPDYSQKAWTRTSMRGKSPRERFDQKVDKSGECWVWIGAKTSRGYGVIQINGKAIYTHRLALEFDGRPLTPGQFALHRCDNPPCVRPAHLYAGSGYDNIHDAIDRDRLRPHHPDPAKSSEHFRRLWAEHPERHPETRKTHCPQGHEYTPENTYWNKAGRKRHCRTCVTAQNRARYHRRHAASSQNCKSASV